MVGIQLRSFPNKFLATGCIDVPPMGEKPHRHQRLFWEVSHGKLGVERDLLQDLRGREGEVAAPEHVPSGLRPVEAQWDGGVPQDAICIEVPASLKTTWNKMKEPEQGTSHFDSSR